MINQSYTVYYKQRNSKIVKAHIEFGEEKTDSFVEMALSVGHKIIAVMPFNCQRIF